jgi:predicted Co/Zn/Cd cation transporter (cation efflux family)
MTQLAEQAERRTLNRGVWANLVMCGGGVAAALLSHSDALLVDGLYSGVNAAAALFAIRVAALARRPADRRYPFGYDGYEALYVSARSLVLLGILVFAAVAAGGKVLDYIGGGQVPDLVLGPILVYSVVAVALCLWLAWQYHGAWKATGRVSDVLAAERRGALIDGLLTAATGAALLASPLLAGTWARGATPIADALLVLLLATLMLPQTLTALRRAVREIAGGSAGGEAGAIAADVVARVLAGAPVRCLDISVMKLGRTHFVVVYLDATTPANGAAMDDLRRRISTGFDTLGAPVRCEVVLTATPPFSD